MKLRKIGIRSLRSLEAHCHDSETGSGSKVWRLTVMGFITDSQNERLIPKILKITLR
jgi:hypothetical protein